MTERETPDAQDAALEKLLSSPLVVGPDPSIIDDVKATPDVTPEKVDPTIELAQKHALDERVAEIYASIVQRAPEHKVQPSTQRVADCLDLMGNPQHSYETIHITGTNGKTSTARMVEALMRERGLRTGRFTSPHLSSVRERITIDGEAISAEDFIAAWEDVAPFIALVDERSQADGGPRMSFFEVFTVMAYWAFAMAPVHVAVVEVGMGGKWDATNVINPAVSVLMPISADHEKWLGANLTEIAEEKLGILHDGGTLVCAAQKPEVDAVVQRHLAEKHAQLRHFGTDFFVVSREAAVGGQMMTIQTPAARYEDVPLAMFGEYQAQNASAAITVVETFFGGGALDPTIVEHALMSTTSPGRLEVVKSSPLVLVDAAHNPAGAAVTREALEENFPGPRVAVFSAMEDKNIDGILGELEPAFEAVVVTEMPGPRAEKLEVLAEQARAVFGAERVHEEADLANAIALASDLAETADPDSFLPGMTVVVGSILLAAAARDVLGAKKPDGLA